MVLSGFGLRSLSPLHEEAGLQSGFRLANRIQEFETLPPAQPYPPNSCEVNSGNPSPSFECLLGTQGRLLFQCPIT